MQLSVLIFVLLISSLMSFGQTPMNASDEWWLNLAQSPLMLSRAKGVLILANRSGKPISRFRLGCASIAESSIKIHKKFGFEGFRYVLEAATEDEFRFESIDNKYFDPEVCKKGKLIVLMAGFTDGTKYEVTSRETSQ